MLCHDYACLPFQTVYWGEISAPAGRGSALSVVCVGRRTSVSVRELSLLLVFAIVSKTIRVVFG